MRTFRRVGSLAAGALALALLPLTGATGQAAAQYTIHLGTEVPHGFSIRAFAPTVNGTPTIRVEKGAIVDFAASGVLFLPAGTGPTEWAADNHGPNAPYGFFLSDPDPDLQAPFPSQANIKLNIAPSFEQTDPSCGGSVSEPCAIDGSRLFNSGARAATDDHFFVRITAEPGATLWAIHPQMVNRQSSLRIQVVTTGVDTASFVNAEAQKLMTRERDRAAALYNKLNSASTKHRVGGRVIHDAWAGYDTNTFALLDFFPAKLKVRKGDKVRWHFSEVLMEVHGLAFPYKRGIEISNNEFLPVCDPDGDTGSGPDTFNVNFETFSCPEGSGQLELDLGTAMTAEKGDGRFPGGPTKEENSGLRGEQVPTGIPKVAGGVAPWDLVFTKASGPKGYRYVCSFHGKFMNATVRVRN